MLGFLKKKFAHGDRSEPDVVFDVTNLSGHHHRAESFAGMSSAEVDDDISVERQQEQLDQEIIFEQNCTFGGKSRFVVISKASIRIFNKKKDWTVKDRKAEPEITLFLYDCYAVVPDVPIQFTFQIRTTKKLLPIKVDSDDMVDRCIAMINAQCTSAASQRARQQYWKEKYTIHLAVTEAWDLAVADITGASDPFLQISVISHDAESPLKNPKASKGKNRTDDIIHVTQVHEQECNPVFLEQFTFLCVEETDHIFIEIWDQDQWSKNEVLGCVRIDLRKYKGQEGLHGWFQILSANENVIAENGYAHIKIGILPAVSSVDHIAMVGSSFVSQRQQCLDNVSSLDPVTPHSYQIPVYVGTWNVGNEAPPEDLSRWLPKYGDKVEVAPPPSEVPIADPAASSADMPVPRLKPRLSSNDSGSFVSMNGEPSNIPFMTQSARTDSEETISEMSTSESVSTSDAIGDIKPRQVKKRGLAATANMRSTPIPILKMDSEPGLYVIGTQECQYAPRAGYTNCKDDWIATLTQRLGNNYTLVEYSSLWQIRLAVFVRNDLAMHVSNMQSHKEATGIGHVLGNKGGVAISLRLYHSSLCFINCHLAAHQTKKDQRNQDVRDIITKSGIKLGNKQSDLANQFHYTWFLGDLNYRLEYGEQAHLKSPPVHEFHELQCLILAQRYSILFGFDQLAREIQKKGIMAGWTEGNYNFPPSFKVTREPGITYNQQRSPAWCDRILWKSYMPDSGDLMQEALTVCDSIATSDHKPVCALFKVNVFQFNESKDGHRGRAEMLFTEVNLQLADQVLSSNSHMYHLRYRSDCFVQNPVVQALADPAKHGQASSSPSLDLIKDSELFMAWFSIPQFPVAKLKHNSLQRLKQHIISIEILHHSGNVVAQGTINFSVFDADALEQAELAAPIVPVRQLTNRLSSIAGPKSITRFSVTIPDSVGHSNATSRTASLTVPDFPEVLPASLTLAPCSETERSPDAPETALEPATPLTPRRKSQMIIRPKSRGGNSTFISPMVDPPRSPAAGARRTHSHNITPTSVEMDRRSMSQNAGQLEHFANVQKNVPFNCDLSMGTTAVGTISGVLRLSWAT